MRLVIDACVLYPTVTREIVIGLAAEGAFRPLWSARILEEWVRAVARNLPGHEGVARAEAALLRADWPEAEIPPDAALESRLWLPDADDRHVLACAIAGRAEGIVTLNRRDFPTRVLAGHGLRRFDPDALAVMLLGDRPALVRRVVARVVARAREIEMSGHPPTSQPSGQAGQARDRGALLKKARLTRLRRAIDRAEEEGG